jgi:hypothetical protein
LPSVGQNALNDLPAAIDSDAFADRALIVSPDDGNTAAALAVELTPHKIIPLTPGGSLTLSAAVATVEILLSACSVSTGAPDCPPPANAPTETLFARAIAIDLS